MLPLNIKGASRFLRKFPSATLDIEPPEALWPATKGQAASLARVRGHPCTVQAITNTEDDEHQVGATLGAMRTNSLQATRTNMNNGTGRGRGHGPI